MNKINKMALGITAIIAIAFFSLIFIRSDISIGEINLKLFTVCIMLGWVMATLFDMDTAGKKVIADREEWKHTKGGIKPMIKWPTLVLRSLLLLIVCLLINHVAPDIYAKLIGS
ncbi:hypothetical protein KKH38_01320 [Patescibacteria group bacterium]|nr:hypothetical protein [Patescibacteria group bacterium]MBU4601043.1 hypothetical protein [Patescibacteria group bacterium]MCG2698779.1 hypothetical protein [Candidatus Parcubacteria bacterium]